MGVFAERRVEREHSKEWVLSLVEWAGGKESKLVAQLMTSPYECIESDGMMGMIDVW
jgi:hypothetical protein